MFSLYAVVEKNIKTASSNFTQVMKFLFGFEGVGLLFLLETICADCRDPLVNLCSPV